MDGKSEAASADTASGLGNAFRNRVPDEMARMSSDILISSVLELQNRDETSIDNLLQTDSPNAIAVAIDEGALLSARSLGEPQSLEDFAGRALLFEPTLEGLLKRGEEGREVFFTDLGNVSKTDSSGSISVGLHVIDALMRLDEPQLEFVEEIGNRSSNALVQFYAAHCLLAEGKLDAAAEIADTILQGFNPDFRPNVESLARVGLNENLAASALDLLESLPESNRRLASGGLRLLTQERIPGLAEATRERAGKLLTS